uniref:Uncharacterized protein n=1 Tax=Glossina palpalis gambiensis TaxID=67801 RepID=A0A1B0ALF0_9MUSC
MMLMVLGRFPFYRHCRRLQSRSHAIKSNLTAIRIIVLRHCYFVLLVLLVQILTYISSYLPGREKLWTLRGYFELTASVCYCSAGVRVEATLNYTTRELSAFEMRGNCEDLWMYFLESVTGDLRH